MIKKINFEDVLLKSLQLAKGNECMPPMPIATERSKKAKM